MNLIEKIDAEKVKIYKLYLINTISNEKFNGITEGLDRAKDIILSEKKEPCDRDYWKAEAIKATAELGEIQILMKGV